VAKKEPTVKLARPQLYAVEDFDGTDPVLPPELSFRDIVNFYQCKNCTLKVGTKVKGLQFLNCERVVLDIADVVGVVEITSSKRVNVYCKGAIHSFTVDKVDNLQINLNEASIDAQIIVAMSQGINVEVPDLNEEGNMIEFPVPEQILLKLKDRKLVHEVYVHEETVEMGKADWKSAVRGCQLCSGWLDNQLTFREICPFAFQCCPVRSEQTLV
jgi:hypothetical protein